jgi:hypothetical protein
MKDKNLLASVALFGELYNNENYKNIADIIAEFIKGAVVYENKFSFNSVELKDLLERVYDFRIPESVIRTTLHGKLKNEVTRKDGYYHFNESLKKDFNNISEEFDTISKKQNQIISKLLEFVEIKEERKLNENEKKELLENFNHFLLDNGYSDKYSNYISAFVVLNEQNDEFKNALNIIREGVILYQGINFTADINELGKWNSEITLYLNTEHLFNSLGYNGILFKEIFDDFHKLVYEINLQSNKDSGRKKVELKYLEETKSEIDNFFLTAESIKKGQKHLDPTKSAMKMILEDCSNPSDVKAKRIRFDLDLKQKNITLQEFNYDINLYSRYNVEDGNSLETLKKTSLAKERYFDEFQCHQYFKIFTKINFFRKGESNKPFEKIGHLFITENGFAKYLAHNNLIKFDEYDIPFAKDIDFIITKFWFKLKKGFSDKKSLPKSFDIVTKAKVILSSHLNSTVSQRYQKLLKETKEGKLTQEEALQRSYEFREKPNRPEDITIENVDISLDFLNNESYFEDIQREQERKETVLNETQKQNEELIKEIQRRDTIEKEILEKKEKEKIDKQKFEYVNSKWAIEKKSQNLNLLFLTFVILYTFCIAGIGILLTVSSELKSWLSKFGPLQISIIVMYGLAIGIELIGSKYIFDKEKLKKAWTWLMTLMYQKKIKTFEMEYKKRSELEFINGEQPN